MSGCAGVLLARPLDIHQGLHCRGLIICSTVTPFELARDPLLGTIISQIFAAARGPGILAAAVFSKVWVS